MTKRLTIVLDDDLYEMLQNYSFALARDELKRHSISRAVRRILRAHTPELQIALQWKKAIEIVRPY
jgi:hypothetical protein